MKIVTITIVLAFSFAQANPRSAARPTLAKADVIGAGVYGAYEVGTLKRKFISVEDKTLCFCEWTLCK